MKTESETLSSRYQPNEIEQRWIDTWQTVMPEHDESKSNYCIMLPPPNVTGSLHMGHGFQVSLMDVLVRYHKMNGANVLWQVGADHAGIATQMVVERQLNQVGEDRHSLGRDAFVDKVWQWKESSGGRIMQQIRRLGAYVDWSRERFTLDEGLSKTVREVFVSLYREKLIYRGSRLVNWDPVLKTALSDLEVINKEKQGSLWHIRYPIVGQDRYLVVATTRPETLLGDSAVAVHPEDARYQDLIGQNVQLPLTDRVIPIIADDYVDPEFGTGCVKITPAHDFNDYEVGQRHHLPVLTIMTEEATLNDSEFVPTAYQGLDRFAARKQMIADLEQQDLMEKVTPHTLQVPHGDRSDAVLEPRLTDQWFMKMDPLAKPAIDAVNTGALALVPDGWKKTYMQWLENIQDWCISRQLWWGHKIPAWYDAEGTVYIGMDEDNVREHYQLDSSLALIQDTDVLDTWFSSALWPFATLDWPNDPAFKAFYPTSVLVTGFDIIFFWLARMVMLGLKFTGEVPFKEAYITGLIRDASGAKMSKSKGNVLDPLDLIDGIDTDSLVQKRCSSLMQPAMAKKIEKATRKEFPEGIRAYGCDALRFTFCALASTGRDINFDMGRLEGYHNFCNKLWNAARYVSMNAPDRCPDEAACEFSLYDRWIQSQLQKTIVTVHQDIKNYRFDRVAQAIYEFVWNTYCDWYLELSKTVLNHHEVSDAQKNGSQRTLLLVLDQILRLTHPIMPYITEELWQQVAVKTGDSANSLLEKNYPVANEALVDASAEDAVIWLQTFVSHVRTIRAEMNIKPSMRIPLLLRVGSDEDKRRFALCQSTIEQLAKIESVAWLSEQDALPETATAVMQTLELHIPLAGLIDKSAEMARLAKQIKKITQEQTRYEAKLNNDNYLSKAPADIVEKARAEYQENQAVLEKLSQSLAKISELAD